jgi:hypothetical protein
MNPILPPLIYTTHCFGHCDMVADCTTQHTGIPYVGCKIRQDVLGAGCGLDLNQLYHCCPGLCLHRFPAVKNGPTETWQFMMKEDACTTPHALTMNNISHRLTRSMHCFNHYWSLNMHYRKSYARGWSNSIAGYRKTLVLDNRTAYHGYFEFLRLETGFELSSSWLIDSCYGSLTNRSGLNFMRWTHIDLGAQDLNGIQRPKLFLKNSWK